MLDLFTIFTKGGIVLWCFRGTQEIFTAPVNALIRSVILQVKLAVFVIMFFCVTALHNKYHHSHEK